jgi:hypothetical protein
MKLGENISTIPTIGALMSCRASCMNLHGGVLPWWLCKRLLGAELFVFNNDPYICFHRWHRGHSNVMQRHCASGTMQ